MCSSMALRGGGASPARCVATTSPSTSEKHHPGLDPASAHAAAAGKWRKLRSGGFAVLYDKCSNLPALMFFPIRDLFTLPSTSTLLDRSIEPQVVTVLIMVFNKLELNLRRLLEEALWQQNQAMLDMGDLAMSRVTK